MNEACVRILSIKPMAPSQLPIICQLSDTHACVVLERVSNDGGVDVHAPCVPIVDTASWIVWLEFMSCSNVDTILEL